MKVNCDVHEIELENDEGYIQQGVHATCDRCGHETESFGTTERSVLRCLAMMREECPSGELNFYTETLYKRIK